MQYIQIGDFEKEIVCNKKDTLSIENSIMEVTKLHDCYLDIQVEMPSLRNGISTGARFHRGLSADASRQHLTHDWCHSPKSTKVHWGNSTNRAPVVGKLGKVRRRKAIQT